MKTKFYYLFLFLGLTLGFTSCEQEEVDPSTTDEAAAVTFAALATNATSNSVSSDSTTTATKPGCVGKKSRLTEIAVSELPAAVTTYITENYAGATVERAGQTKEGGFVVQIAQADGTKVALVFDANGTFVSIDTHHKRGTEVAVADLPATITDYINTTYSGATIMKAMKDATGAYVVVIKKVDETLVGVAFTAEGAFKSELTLNGDFGRGKGGKGGKKHGK
ncbi:MAG: PepSY-like domain-containing protein [Rufibacter sp.]